MVYNYKKVILVKQTTMLTSILQCSIDITTSLRKHILGGTCGVVVATSDDVNSVSVATELFSVLLSVLDE